MLIDATHPEETRVAVVDGRRLEEFDVEVASRKQLKGNIYLAKITRVEPSLQAAFVEYGGNRHGFLAFSEIHPDYYRIPLEDREALLAEQAAMAREQDEQEADGVQEEARPSNSQNDEGQAGEARSDEPSAGEPSGESFEVKNAVNMPLLIDGEPGMRLSSEPIEPTAPRQPHESTLTQEAPAQPETPAEETPRDTATSEAHAAGEGVAESGIGATTDAVSLSEEASGDAPQEAPAPASAQSAADEAPEHRAVIEEAPPVPQALETVGGDETEESSSRRPRPLSRRYKIQDVIKRRQILLVQVTKEERGNKGAALTTYLSLAGR